MISFLHIFGFLYLAVKTISILVQRNNFDCVVKEKVIHQYNTYFYVLFIYIYTHLLMKCVHSLDWEDNCACLCAFVLLGKWLRSQY